MGCLFFLCFLLSPRSACSIHRVARRSLSISGLNNSVLSFSDKDWRNCCCFLYKGFVVSLTSSLFPFLLCFLFLPMIIALLVIRFCNFVLYCYIITCDVLLLPQQKSLLLLTYTPVKVEVDSFDHFDLTAQSALP